LKKIKNETKTNQKKKNNKNKTIFNTTGGGEIVAVYTSCVVVFQVA
jgi:hypothetical protein